MMKIIKPDYYDEFMCIAGECPFNCCHDWKITVDKDTKKKWHSLAINTNNVLDEDSDSIRLKPNGDCPFLDENRLCLIVKEYGERAISHTCHTFPRESHGFKERIELSLTVGCPVALDLLWSKENFSLIEESSCDLGMSNSNTTCTTNHLFFRIREEFCNLMSDSKFSIAQVLKMIFFMMLSWDEKEQLGEKITEKDVEDAFDKEFLAKLNAAVDDANCDPFDNFLEQNELFLDLAENYRKKNIYTQVLEPLAKRAEKYEDESLAKSALEKRKDFEAVFESFDKQIRLLMTEEIFATLVLPDTDMYTMLLKIQWLGMIYAVLKQCLFLFWDEHDRLELEEIKQIVMVIIRMTGYTEADIEEYMDKSFEEIIWDWGYMALIV